MLRAEPSLTVRRRSPSAFQSRGLDCGCRGAGGRRQFLRVAGAAGLAGLGAGLFPLRAFAADLPAVALLLSCIDYRLTTQTVNYMTRQKLTDQYDHLTLAGASLGAQTIFPFWVGTFWEEFKIALKLHPKIDRVYLLDHRDCGAYKEVFGIDFAKNPPLETRVHADELRKLKGTIIGQYPKFTVDTVHMGLMDLKGNVETID